MSAELTGTEYASACEERSREALGAAPSQENRRVPRRSIPRPCREVALGMLDDERTRRALRGRRRTRERGGWRRAAPGGSSICPAEASTWYEVHIIIVRRSKRGILAPCRHSFELAQLIELAEQPTMAELLERIRERKSATASTVTTELILETRDKDRD